MLTDFPGRANQSFALWEQRISSKAWALSVVPHFSFPPRLAVLAWADFHARSLFAVEGSRSGLIKKSESAHIFHRSFLWLLRHTDEPPKGWNSCLWLQSRSVLSSFGVVLMSCKVNFHVVRYCSILLAELNMSTCHFCWSGLYRSYVLRHIRLRSFAVLCG